MLRQSMPLPIEALYETIHEACLPGLWSKGVALARAGQVIKESESADELTVRVQAKDRPTSPRVQLWPTEDDWFCDCGEKHEVCSHAAAAVVAVKNGQLVSRDKENPSHSLAPFVLYRFTRSDGALSFDRYIVRPKEEELLQGSLISLVGGVGSGRIQSSSIVTSKEDFAVDGLLTTKKRGVFETPLLHRLFTVLKDCANIRIDDQEIRVSSIPLTPTLEITNEENGYRLNFFPAAGITESFSNGAALCEGVLHPVPETALDSQYVSHRDLPRFVSETLPRLEKACSVKILAKSFPKLNPALRPRIVIRLEQLEQQTLVATAKLVYGAPAAAEVYGDQIQVLEGRDELPQRDRDAEQKLLRRLQGELHLTLRQPAKFNGANAIDFRSALAGWETEGASVKTFESKGTLSPWIELNDDGRFSVGFTAGQESAESSAVFQAWREGEKYASLLGGGFAALPNEWLEKHGPMLEALLSSRRQDGKLPSHYLPALADAAEDLGARLPFSVERLRRSLEHFEGIAQADLPSDLKADLRGYQRLGVNWLCFLRENGMGALLADDMGLGKTLQTLCALKGRSLIIAPTSVLHSWAEQIDQFRPGTKYSVYHGDRRTLGNDAELILTTYSILRLDRERLNSQPWQTIVLDEAQTIKNPESQVAQAAHSLQADFKIALTGTPVENRLEDLWSQFQFLNPGLLGSRERFVEAANKNPSLVRKRIKPFLLRRLKQQVAPELPPRTDVTLHAELSLEERTLYDSILAATRSQVAEKIGMGSSVMQLLEALLRLRQACCHPSLVPGQDARFSAKTELLVDTLQESIALGHRALVFSQWTSYLDLIEPQLKAAQITFNRLDGGTPNRQEIVQEFQKEGGPDIMLLSLKAGGVGLNLTAADHVFLLDPWWNPAVENQAADRAHRIGQRNPVIVHRLIAQGTVEEKILALQKSKLELAKSLLEDAASGPHLTKEDLLELLR
ncbi:MAG: SNF2-related protein [Bdellovibrionota bacterium]